MQRAAQVVLADLGVIQRPPVVLALADMHPLAAGGHADVHPVARELPRLCRALPDPGDQPGHSVTGQERLQVIDLAVLDRAFWQDDDIDGVGLVPGRGEHPVHQVQVEPFGGRELEEAEGVVGQPLQRPPHRPEV